MKPMRKRSISTPLATLLIVPLALMVACKPVNYQEEGFEALQDGNYEKAAQYFAAAAAKVRKDSPEFHQIAVGRCQALAHTNPDLCLKTFNTIVKDEQIVIEARDYETVVGELMQARAYVQAAKITMAGIQELPDNMALPEFQTQLKKLAEQPENSELSTTISSSGYGGGQ